METVCRRFHDQLDEITKLLKFVTASQKFINTASYLIGYVETDNHLKNEIKEFQASRVADSKILLQGLHIQICASFESFVRRLASTYIDELCRILPSHDDLSKQDGQPILRNMKLTGIALQQVFDGRKDLNLDFNRLVENLATTLPGGKSVKLNSNTFPLFIGSFDSSALDEIFRRIGLSKVNLWLEVWKDAALKKFFERLEFGKTEKATCKFLDQFVKHRNSIAHGSDANPAVSEFDLQHAISFFRCFSSGLTSLLKSKLEKLEAAKS